MDRNQQIKNLLSSSAAIHGGEDKVFMLFQLALCGHMTQVQQERFLADAAGRLLINNEGNTTISIEDIIATCVKHRYPNVRVDVRSSCAEDMKAPGAINLGGIIALDSTHTVRTKRLGNLDKDKIQILICDEDNTEGSYIGSVTANDQKGQRQVAKDILYELVTP